MAEQELYPLLLPTPKLLQIDCRDMAVPSKQSWGEQKDQRSCAAEGWMQREVCTVFSGFTALGIPFYLFLEVGWVYKGVKRKQIYCLHQLGAVNRFLPNCWLHPEIRFAMQKRIKEQEHGNRSQWVSGLSYLYGIWKNMFYSDVVMFFPPPTFLSVLNDFAVCLDLDLLHWHSMSGKHFGENQLGWDFHNSPEHTPNFLLKRKIADGFPRDSFTVWSKNTTH